MNGVEKNRVAQSFNAVSGEYDQVAVLQRTVSDRLLDRLQLINIDPGNILDLGAGTGYSARTLGKKYKNSRVLQLDMAIKMSIMSRSKAPRFFSRQHYVNGDLENMPLVNSGFDLVYSSMALQWCNNLDNAFSETVRVLNPGGFFIFATLGPDTLKELRQSWAAADNHIHVNTFIDMHDIGDAMVRAGFENVVMDVETITMTYPDCLALMRELKLLGAHNVNTGRHKGLTGKDRLNKVLQQYETYRKHGKLPASFEIIYGHAWKPAQAKQKFTAHTESYIPVTSITKRSAD